MVVWCVSLYKQLVPDDMNQAAVWQNYTLVKEPETYCCHQSVPMKWNPGCSQTGPRWGCISCFKPPLSCVLASGRSEQHGASPHLHTTLPPFPDFKANRWWDIDGFVSPLYINIHSLTHTHTYSLIYQHACVFCLHWHQLIFAERNWPGDNVVPFKTKVPTVIPTAN